MSYRAHDRLTKLARPSASLLRLAAGTVVTVCVLIGIVMVFNWLQVHLIPVRYQSDWSEAMYGANTPLAALVNLYAFVFAIVALSIAMRLVHNRSWTGLIGGGMRALRQFFSVLKALALLNLVFFLLPAEEGLQPSLNLAFGLWLMYLPLTLLGLLIQTGSEELLFRGYLQSQLAARFRSPLIWILLPSVAFGLLHYSPDVEDTAAWLVVLWATCFGLAAADLTARTGTLGPAIALHMVNNLVAIAFYAPAGSFDGLALYTVPLSMSDSDALLAWMPVELTILLCSWLASRLACRV